VATSGDTIPLRQLEFHVSSCPDLEILDYVGVPGVVVSDRVVRRAHPDEEPQRLAARINQIFEEEGIGYRWVAGRLVRFDGEVTHELAVVPALTALATGRFGAAQAEFDAALTAFRRGDYRDTLTHANAALESVLKVLTGKTSGTAGDLIKEARRQGLIPKPLGGSVENLEKLMHGIPAIRGQEGSSHGLGERPAAADEQLAQLVLTVTAAVITFMVTSGAAGDAPASA
jgi:HEPN domain-containing protein